MGLFLIGPAFGIVLIQLIFDLPKPLWWSAGLMGLFMLFLFTILIIKERALIVRKDRVRHIKTIE